MEKINKTTSSFVLWQDGKERYVFPVNNIRRITRYSKTNITVFLDNDEQWECDRIKITSDIDFVQQFISGTKKI